jgi:prepilin-type N-terminal cleavage/methylation domain-containing protein
MSAAGKQSGFTLLEILVVMGMTALIAMIVAPNIEHSLGLMQLRETVGALQANLRVMRSDALRSDQPVTFSLSADGNSYGWSEGETRRLPAQMVLRLAGSQTIRFYGDGTSTGGTIVASSGSRKIPIVVDAATGAVSAER